MSMRATPKTSVNQDQAKNAFREKLGEFVRAGKITRAEAGELYRAAFPEKPPRPRPVCDQTLLLLKRF